MVFLPWKHRVTGEKAPFKALSIYILSLENIKKRQNSKKGRAGGNLISGQNENENSPLSSVPLIISIIIIQIIYLNISIVI